MTAQTGKHGDSNLSANWPHVRLETPHWERGVAVAGVDEAGRGPLAGPVVAAAVIFPPETTLDGVRDSKKLTSARREALFQAIGDTALSVGVGRVDHDVIDQINILQATYQAMRLAVEKLSPEPGHVLVDGRPIPELPVPQTAIVGGDRCCFSIAAASIVAKVTRDRLMMEYDKAYPVYGFARHKGYGTRSHIQMIRRYGFCPIHRKTFRISGWNRGEEDGRRSSEEGPSG